MLGGGTVFSYSLRVCLQVKTVQATTGTLIAVLGALYRGSGQRDTRALVSSASGKGKTFLPSVPHYWTQQTGRQNRGTTTLPEGGLGPLGETG